MSETPGRVAPGCLVGQHTDDPRGVGYSAEEIAEFEAQQVVFGRADERALTPA